MLSDEPVLPSFHVSTLLYKLQFQDLRVKSVNISKVIHGFEVNNMLQNAGFITSRYVELLMMMLDVDVGR